MRIQLIFPNINYGLIAKNVIHPPLGLGYLAAVLIQSGHEVDIIDAAALNLSFEAIFKRTLVFNPDLIGITTNISSASIAITTARFLKKRKDTPVILGGPWASIEYDIILKANVADYVVVGEGEISFLEFVKALEGGKSPLSVKGIAFKRDDGKIQFTKNGEYIHDLDTLPFPAWELFPSSKSYPYNNRYFPYYPILTSRGCPFSCIYCTKVIHGYKIRYRSVDNVIEEIRHLKEDFKIKELIIADDNFTQDIERAEQIFDEIHDRNFGIKILFSNGIRSDIYSESLVSKMKRAGVYRVFLGIESGNQQVVNKIRKGLNLKKIVDFIGLLRKYHIDHYGYFMLGLPYDNYQTMMDTINFAIKLNLKPHFHKTIAFPGTALFDIVKGKLTTKDGMNLSYRTAGATFEMYKGQGKELNKALGFGYLRYYMRPRSIIQTIRDTKTPNDIRWLINGGLNILQMVMRSLSK
ncbi:MAG: B12-binding domain-containing radical SAM protein [Promethearchaeota archaeon]